ncbi:hypothetical protein PCE1_005022 [Barthelona sp. PCE]
MSEHEDNVPEPTIAETPQSELEVDDESVEKLVAEIIESTRLQKMEAEFLVKEGKHFNKDSFFEMFRLKNFSDVLCERFWQMIDEDGSGVVSVVEVAKIQSTIEYSNDDEVVEFFFSLYDENGDGQISFQEIWSVYSGMLVANGDAVTDEKRDELFGKIDHFDINKDGFLSLEEFKDAVDKLQEVSKEGKKKSKLFYIYLFILSALMELSTSFGLPAVGALAVFLSGGQVDGEGLTRNYSLETIASLASLYYLSAMIALSLGAFVERKTNCGVAMIVGNTLVLLANFLCTFDSIAVFIIGRLVLGLGGEIIPPQHLIMFKATLPPKLFNIAAGYRNLIQASTTAAAYVVLAWMAEEKSVDYVLWFNTALGGISLVIAILAWIIVRKEKEALLEDEKSVARSYKMIARTIQPKVSKKCFFNVSSNIYLAAIGIKAFYLIAYALPSVGTVVFVEKFGVSASEAGSILGLLNLVGALGSIPAAIIGDKFGNRAKLFTALLFICSILFCLLGISTDVWLLYLITIVFGIAYAFGDTLAFTSLFLLTPDPNETSKSYALYGLVGNCLQLVIPIIASTLISKGEEYFFYFFAVVIFLCSLCWLRIRLAVGRKSRLEMTLDEIVETNTDAVKAALFLGNISTVEQMQSVDEVVVIDTPRPM